MIISFSYPSTHRYGGGVDTLFSYADGLARRGHTVHLIHGPAIPDLISSPDDISWHRFEPAITHHVVASLADPSLPAADVIFQPDAPPHLGQPVVLIQGYKLLAAALERPAFRAACPKVCVAGWLTRVGQAWGSPPEQLLHVPPGIDHQHFRPAGAATERPIDVAMLYTDHPVKGGADGLAALDLVRRRRPDLRVVLFGMLPPGELPPWATFRQAPDHETLAAEIYGCAKVFLQPSWREGFGLTAVEAMACGAALVTTDNGGSEDYARPGFTAEVAPPRDPASLAAAIERLLDDDAHRGNVARAGEDLAATFTWDHAAELLEDHLERYLADPAALQRPPSDAPMFLEDSW